MRIAGLSKNPWKTAHPSGLASHKLVAFKDQIARPLSGADGHSSDFDPRQAGCQLFVDDGFSQKLATLAGAGISMNSLWSLYTKIANGRLIHVTTPFDRKKL